MDHEAGRSLTQIQHATARLLTSVSTLGDAQAREPSLLPGWTRGHVLTHVARNADAIGNLLRSARTGTEIPMYPSDGARDGDIERGSGRPASALLADLRATAGALEREAATMPDEAWPVLVRARRGQVTAHRALLMRLLELEVHHVDLGIGYLPGQWPEHFALAELAVVAAGMGGRDDVPACLLRAEGSEPIRIGPTTTEPVTVTGPATAVLAWLLSRADGDGLVTEPAGALPAMPAFG